MCSECDKSIFLESGFITNIDSIKDSNKDSIKDTNKDTNKDILNLLIEKQPVSEISKSSEETKKKLKNLKN